MNKTAGYKSHRPRKRFGQHFLHDPAILREITDRFDPRPGDRVLEIGPGLGSLTEALLKKLPALHAVELDRDLAAMLAARFGERLQLHQGDVLQFDFLQLACQMDGKLRLIGNLPYNISSPLLFRLLEQREAVEDMQFMLQREVVERLTAQPGGKGYSRLTVMTGLVLEAERLFDVPPAAFRPPPLVESSVVRLRPRREAMSVKDMSNFRRVVGQAFSHRRKTLRNALKGMADAEQLLAAEIDPAARPETIPIEDYVRLVNSLKF